MATQYVAPVSGTWAAKGSSPFGAARGRKGRMHAGNDLQVANGTKAVAVIGGKVIYAGHNSGYQWNAVVLGDDGNAYRYATHGPLDVKYGQRVEQGKPVGAIARSHLHFEVIPEGSPALKAMLANPGTFVSTQWWPNKEPVTVDPAKFFGVEKGAEVAAGKPVGNTALASAEPEVANDPFGVAEYQRGLTEKEREDTAAVHGMNVADLPQTSGAPLTPEVSPIEYNLARANAGRGVVQAAYAPEATSPAPFDAVMAGNQPNETLAGGNMPLPRARPPIENLTDAPRRGQTGDLRRAREDYSNFRGSPGPDLLNADTYRARPSFGESMTRPEDYISGVASQMTPERLSADNYRARLDTMPLPRANPRASEVGPENMGVLPPPPMPSPRMNPRRAETPENLTNSAITDRVRAQQDEAKQQAIERARQAASVRAKAAMDEVMLMTGRVPVGTTLDDRADLGPPPSSAPVMPPVQPDSGLPYYDRLTQRPPGPFMPRPEGAAAGMPSMAGPFVRPEGPAAGMPAAPPETPEAAQRRMQAELAAFLGGMNERAGTPYGPNFDAARPGPQLDLTGRPQTQGAVMDPSMAIPQVPMARPVLPDDLLAGSAHGGGAVTPRPVMANESARFGEAFGPPTHVLPQPPSRGGLPGFLTGANDFLFGGEPTGLSDMADWFNRSPVSPASAAIPNPRSGFPGGAFPGGSIYNDRVPQFPDDRSLPTTNFAPPVSDAPVSRSIYPTINTISPLEDPTVLKGGGGHGDGLSLRFASAFAAPSTAAAPPARAPVPGAAPPRPIPINVFDERFNAPTATPPLTRSVVPVSASPSVSIVDPNLTPAGLPIDISPSNPANNVPPPTTMVAPTATVPTAPPPPSGGWYPGKMRNRVVGNVARNLGMDNFANRMDQRNQNRGILGGVLSQALGAIFNRGAAPAFGGGMSQAPFVPGGSGPGPFGGTMGGAFAGGGSSGSSGWNPAPGAFSGGTADPYNNIRSQ